MRKISPVLIVLLTIGFFLNTTRTQAQDNVGIGTITPDPSALLEIQALNKGLLIPRTDTLSITNPATGLLIYTVTDSSFWYFDGILWRRGIGPQGPQGPLIPGLHGQTMRYDTVFFNDWVANSFIWNNEFHVGINTNQPDSSAVMDLISNDKGFLPPRMDENARNNIQNPAFGLIIANTTDSTVGYYNGTCWLPTYAQDCNSCYLDITPTSIADTIDRVISQNQNLGLNVVQLSGIPQQIAITILSTLPSGLTATITPNPAPSTGVVNIDFFASPFAPAGTYPIVIQVLCNNSSYNIVYSLTILPCYQVPVINTVNNYNLGTAFYNLYPNAPTNSPVCVVCLIDPGVEISSPTTAQPAFTTGTLPAGSLVAIVNEGNNLGRGGDGGDAYDPALALTGDGFPGGTAIDLTLDADIVNNFNIYGGGGGGGSMAFSISTGNLIPPPAPAFGFFIGAGGGGGANFGEGGDQPPNLIGLSWYSPGQDATGGQFGVPGLGGSLNFPIVFSIGPAQIDINPNAVGGNGGPYGYPGTQGFMQILISVSVVVNIPFIGPITIPVVTNLALPLPIPPPLAGNGGFAVKRNGFTTNIPDNLYNTSFLRGEVGP